MSPIISILIPTLESRKVFFDRLVSELFWQLDQIPNGRQLVEIMQYQDKGELTTGAKRNWLVNNAKGQYVAGFDDDDMPTDCYMQVMLKAAESGADCGEFRGLYFSNGVYDRPFHHSIQYDRWWQNQYGYYRNPNHISLIKRELILDIPFKDITVGEDGQFSLALQASGRLKTEFPVKETLYLYYARTKKEGE
jgi:glycosyltransferase involved in cell wall biosynthesis